MIEIKYKPISMEELPIESIKIETMEDLFKFKRSRPSFPLYAPYNNVRWMYVEITKGSSVKWSKICPVHCWQESVFNYLKTIIFHEYVYSFIMEDKNYV